MLDIRRQMAKIKDSLRSVELVDEESDDSQLFSVIQTERLDCLMLVHILYIDPDIFLG